MTIHFTKESEKENRRRLRERATFNEKLMWLYIRRKQISGERFLRQFSVDSYILDFYCPRLKLAIEIDGPDHFKNDEAIQYDKRRQKHIESYGISFIRFKDDELTNCADEVFKRLEDKVRELQKEKEVTELKGGI